MRIILNYFKVKEHLNTKGTVPIFTIITIIIINLIFILIVYAKYNTAVDRFMLLDERININIDFLYNSRLKIKDAVYKDKILEYQDEIYKNFENSLKENKKFRKEYIKRFNPSKDEKFIKQAEFFSAEQKKIYSEMKECVKNPNYIFKLDKDFKKITKELIDFSDEINKFVYQEIEKYKNYSILTVLIFFIFNIIILMMYITFRRENGKLYNILKCKEERLKYAVEGTQDGLWDLNLKTKACCYSKQWKNILGYENDEISDILSSWEKLVHPDDLKELKKQEVGYFKDKKINFENKYRIKHKDGHWIWVLDRGKIIYNENSKPIRMIGFNTDISKKVEIENELHKSKQLFERFMENIPAYISIKNKDNSVAYANTALTDFLNKTSLVGKNALQLLPKNIADKLIQLGEETKQNGYAETIIDYTDKNNQIHKYKAMAFVIGEKDENMQIGSMYFDISNEMHLKEELENKDKIMLAQSRHAAMGEMIGMIAHQWRQPITVIAMGANNLLIDIDLEDINEESIAEEAQSIIEQTEYLSKTIDDFRNFFRPDKEKEEASINEIILEANKIISKSLEHKRISLSIKYEKNYEVATYSRELLQVFINIIRNAEDVLVEKRETNRQINITIDDNKEYIFINISDNGGGINEDIIDDIFNPYFSTKSKKTGTGLGLYMSKTIIEKHLEGTIKASNIDNGACFEIAIPYKKE